MRNRGGEFSFFQEIHIRIDISSDISSSKRPMTTNFVVQVHLPNLTQIRLLKQVLMMP